MTFANVARDIPKLISLFEIFLTGADETVIISIKKVLKCVEGK